MREKGVGNRPGGGSGQGTAASRKVMNRNLIFSVRFSFVSCLSLWFCRPAMFRCGDNVFVRLFLLYFSSYWPSSSVWSHSFIPT